MRLAMRLPEKKPGDTSIANDIDPRDEADAEIIDLAQRNAFVAQTSIADANHLGDSMLQALRFEGPALVQVYAPSPSRHGFMPQQSLMQAQLAIASRALPLFRYSPTAAGVFGLRIGAVHVARKEKLGARVADDVTLLDALDEPAVRVQ